MRSAPWSPTATWSPPAPRAGAARAGRRWRRLRRLARRARRPLAALLLAVATGVVTHALLAPSAQQGGSAAVVAVRDLPAGAALTGSTTVVELPAPVLPAGALTPAQTAGDAGAHLRLAAPVRRGEVLTDVRVVGGAAVLASLAPGQVALPVGLAQPLPTGLLSPGQRVSVLAAGDAALAPLDGGDHGRAPGVLARGATVLAVDEAATATGLLAPAAGPTAVVLALDDAAAALVAAAAASGGVVLALSP